MKFNEKQATLIAELINGIIGLSTQGKITTLKINNQFETEGGKMDIQEFTKQQGTFLKAEDVMKSNTKKFIILTEAKIVHNERYDTDRLHIIGELDQVDYVFDCSRTNARTIETILGSDTKKWVGKQIVLEVYKTKTKEGKMVDAINVVADKTEKTKVVKMV